MIGAKREKEHWKRLILDEFVSLMSPLLTPLQLIRSRRDRTGVARKATQPTDSYRWLPPPHALQPTVAASETTAAASIHDDLQTTSCT
jgi:hypothetical protein